MPIIDTLAEATPTKVTSAILCLHPAPITAVVLKEFGGVLSRKSQIYLPFSPVVKVSEQVIKYAETHSVLGVTVPLCHLCSVAE